MLASVSLREYDLRSVVQADFHLLEALAKLLLVEVLEMILENWKAQEELTHEFGFFLFLIFLQFTVDDLSHRKYLRQLICLKLDTLGIFDFEIGDFSIVVVFLLLLCEAKAIEIVDFIVITVITGELAAVLI